MEDTTHDRPEGLTYPDNLRARVAALRADLEQIEDEIGVPDDIGAVTVQLRSISDRMAAFEDGGQDELDAYFDAIAHLVHAGGAAKRNRSAPNGCAPDEPIIYVECEVCGASPLRSEDLADHMAAFHQEAGQ